VATGAASGALAPLPAPVELTASAPDGLELYGSFYEAADKNAPVLVLLHRMTASRDEWKPLLDIVLRRPARPHVLALDLRGHGRSTVRKGSKATVLWPSITATDAPALTADVLAALAAVDKRLGKPAPAFVVVGSDLGATVGVLAAAREPRVAALGLVSPGAGLRGIDLYRPFAQVRGRPNFLAAAADDNIAREPMKTLAAMGRDQSTVKTYPGGEHGGALLGAASPALWTDLASWVDARTARPPAAPASPPAP
jgi:pimeloyl-ACP methyl ester carboxylesterase